MYEFIVRHFLACVSKDAKGEETNVLIDINGEQFSAAGLMVLERNYLDVYPYESWNSKNIHHYQIGQSFHPTLLDIEQSQTTPPNLLTEADLIALMEKHGIGTDATHAEHIETIKARRYVGLEGNYFVPSAVGMGLVEGYDSMGFAMSKPHLRAELESDLKRICDGIRQPKDVLQEQVNKYKTLFQKAKEQVNKIDAAISKYIQATAVTLTPENDPLNVQSQSLETIMRCRLCGLPMNLRSNETSKYLSCSGFPICRSALWLPNKVLEVKVSDEMCEICGPEVRKLEFKFVSGSMFPYYPNTYVGCLNGCDQDFIDMLGVRIPKPSSSSNSISSEQFSTPLLNSTPSDSTFRNNSQRSSQTSINVTQRNSDDSVRCSCNEPAKKLTVKKDGPNKGKMFYVCPKNQNEQCKFFLWDDPVLEENRSNGRGHSQGSYRGNTSSNYRSQGRRRNSSRKCGLCSGTGHTRRNCPQNVN